MTTTQVHGAAARVAAPLMLIPLVVLAVMAAIAGFFNLGDDLGDADRGLAAARDRGAGDARRLPSWAIAIVVDGGRACRAWALRGWCTARKVVEPERVRHIAEPVPEMLENKYYLDWLYEELIVRRIVLRWHWAGCLDCGTDTSSMAL